MTVSQEFLIQSIATFAFIILSFLAGLMALMWKNINTRLQTLGHEDRAIRDQLHSVMNTLIDDLKDRKNEDTLKAENARLQWMLKTTSTTRDPDLVRGP